VTAPLEREGVLYESGRSADVLSSLVPVHESFAIGQLMDWYMQ